ncbi:MAG: 4Fe-4S dicluster domain-containing protein [Candidatus Omnitrophica bacterium]|nr:4Fe-4S dicluster domain-containing protein [Candidatus Omnitrophota bacterium]MBU1905693.1 4Fe-4S dicluster domain-containing protein [Candidatus Omnitrophota bacterium]
MAKVTINKDKCKGCLFCINVCPRKTLKKSVKLNKRGVNYVEFKSGKQCVGCTMCAIICPDCCIEVYK